MKVKIIDIASGDAYAGSKEALLGLIGEFVPESTHLSKEWSAGSFFPCEPIEEDTHYFFRLVKVEPLEKEEVTVTSPVVSSPIKRKFKITLEVQVEEMTEEEA